MPRFLGQGSIANSIVCCWRSRNIRKAIFKLVAVWITCNTLNENEGPEASGINSRRYDCRCQVQLKSLNRFQELKIEQEKYTQISSS